jgi:hypothetical protein
MGNNKAKIRNLIIILTVLVVASIFIYWPQKCRQVEVCPICPAYKFVCEPWWVDFYRK